MQHLRWKIGELSSLHPKPFSQNKQNEMDRNTNLLFPSLDMEQVELFERETSLFSQRENGYNTLVFPTTS